MRWISKLGRAQRVVLVVALGVAFLAAGSYLVRLGQPRGWTGYAPLSTPHLGPPEWLRLVVWLALTSLWAVLSILLLRPSKTRE